jgi:hypothetical protein|uniref:Uncharacterized protein n=1 Tax=Zea mays TaxID=4577 RepID=A0A804PX03_MAIZE
MTLPTATSMYKHVHSHTTMTPKLVFLQRKDNATYVRAATRLRRRRRYILPGLRLRLGLGLGLGPAACLAAARAPAQDGAEDAAGHPRRGRVHVGGHVLGPEHPLLLPAARLLHLLRLLIAVVAVSTTEQHADAPDAPGVPELRLGVLGGGGATAGLRLRLGLGLGQEPLVPDQARGPGPSERGRRPL